ncbi:MAG: sulfide-dependent adenosine diphosphate thiazole synthase [Thermoanaerobacterium sp.]|uniref:Thiamine thiazole synthase n=1 Tax=Thermoanaerobacterium butyriciformans TaxID=1702242 RepID=A0ABS4NHU5_9THEO|nr:MULTISPECIES: sulfide-dependent adenosine diphosphate thiazole synthase [Thermoanaerobacterium]MBP2072593.1 thiamine thiazole synthase [Thermoanaerobacterium butyriciformans]MDI3478563.1 sulfide-dependent adenosine diphosphate thiazole synthase [Thermoanaerobacterium sp.]MDN5317809.1 sulfide-dependent adenosine diphosphate thiazole synthase [Thermoanaerobacterium sp.]WKV09255.1 sulfide-dependent adenosine diphosphate thiazole synthase [Thermoanaerobacterium sp. CMT5567-10]
MKNIKNPISDEKISRLILKSYFEDLYNAVSSDVIITGAGPSGLYCAILLAKNGFKVTVLDKKLSPGGGIWGGAMSFNRVVLQKDVKDILKELNIPYNEEENALIVSSISFASNLIAKATSFSNIKFFNLISVVDLYYIDEKISGVVVNNSTIELQKLFVDPMVLVSKAVLDATGHDAVLVSFYNKRRKVDMIKEFFMNAERGEEEVINNTKMIAPGLFVAGMAANNVYGGHRMGPIFGGMLLSGKKAANLIADYLNTYKK